MLFTTHLAKSMKVYKWEALFYLLIAITKKEVQMDHFLKCRFMYGDHGGDGIAHLLLDISMLSPAEIMLHKLH